MSNKSNKLKQIWSKFTNKIISFKDKLKIKSSVSSPFRQSIWIVGTIIILGAIVCGGVAVKHHIDYRLHIEDIKNDPAIQAEIERRKMERRFIHKIAKPARANYKANHQVLPCVTIAQGIVESNWGTSGLYKDANNAFGVKGKYYGKSVTMKTNEVIDGNTISENSKFKKYPNLTAAVKDHDFLLQKIFLKRSNIKNYRTDAKLLYKNHYATDPTYPKHLIRVIKGYHLTKYDHVNQK